VNDEASEDRRAVSWKAVTFGFWALLVLALVFAVVIYFALIRYERVAARHLPRGTDAALRLDVEKAVLFEPTRKQLLPLANEFVGPRYRFDLRSRLDRLQSKSGLELAVDLREAVFGIGPRLGDWVLVLGGRFPRSGVIPALNQVLREEGYYFELSKAEDVMTLPSGISVAQSADGCLVAASSRERLSLALDVQDTYRELGLLPEGPGAFAVSQGFFTALAESGAAPRLVGLADTRSIERATGRLELGAEVEIKGTLELAATDDHAPAVERAERLLRGLRALVQPADLGGEQRLLDRAEVRADGPSRVSIRTLWARPDVDRAAHALATALREAAPARPGPKRP